MELVGRQQDAHARCAENKAPGLSPHMVPTVDEQQAQDESRQDEKVDPGSQQYRIGDSGKGRFGTRFQSQRHDQHGQEYPDAVNTQSFTGPGDTAEHYFLYLAWFKKVAPCDFRHFRFLRSVADFADLHVRPQEITHRLLGFRYAAVGDEPSGTLFETDAAEQHDDRHDCDKQQQTIPKMRIVPLPEQEETDARCRDAAQRRSGFRYAYHQQFPSPGHDFGNIVRIEAVTAADTQSHKKQPCDQTEEIGCEKGKQ